MAGDVGGSTTGRISRRERLYATGHDALENWAAFLRATSVGPMRYHGDPMFRDVRAGYRETRSLRSDYDEDYAIQCDRLFASLFRACDGGVAGDLAIALRAYAMAQSSRQAAKALGMSPDEYRHRLDELVARVDAALVVSRLPMQFGVRVE